MVTLAQPAATTLAAASVSSLALATRFERFTISDVQAQQPMVGFVERTVSVARRSARGSVPAPLVVARPPGTSPLSARPEASSWRITRRGRNSSRWRRRIVRSRSTSDGE